MIASADLDKSTRPPAASDCRESRHAHPRQLLLFFGQGFNQRADRVSAFQPAQNRGSFNAPFGALGPILKYADDV